MRKPRMRRGAKFIEFLYERSGMKFVHNHLPAIASCDHSFLTSSIGTRIGRHDLRGAPMGSLITAVDKSA